MEYAIQQGKKGGLRRMIVLAACFVTLIFFIFTSAVEARGHIPCGNFTMHGQHVAGNSDCARSGAGCPRGPLVDVDPPPPDQCSNIRGYQYPVPTGFEKRAGSRCVLKTEFYVSCRAVPNPVLPNSSFNFLAIPFYHSGDVTFEWYEGNTSGGALLFRDTTDGISALRTNFDTEGNQQVTVVAEDDAGNRQERICGVSVRADADEVDQAADGLAGDASLTFDLEEALTNNTCTAIWRAENVAQCFLVNTRGTTNALEVFEGEQEVPPGTWFMRCIASTLQSDGTAAIIQSDEKVCRQNLDIRET